MTEQHVEPDRWGERLARRLGLLSAVAVVGLPKASRISNSVVRKLPFASGLPTWTVIVTVPPPPGGIASKNQVSSSWTGGGTAEMKVTFGSYSTSIRVPTEVDVPMFPKETV